MLSSICGSRRIFCRIVRSGDPLQRHLLLLCSCSSIHPSDELLPLTSSQSSRHHHHHTSRCSQHRTSRTITTNAATATTTKTNESLPPIEGTIPLHGKGLKMSQYAEVQRIFTQDDVNLFGRLSGDMNPVHFPREDALTSSIDADDSSDSNSSNNSEDKKKAPIVHGILLSSLFSNIFGTLIPGAIYRHQTLKFHHVVHVNELVVGRVVVTKLRQINRRGQKSGGGGVLCTCDTSVIKIVQSDGLTKKQQHDKSNHEGSNSNGEQEEIITCISGDAQVWLPDLQLVYECREKGG